MKEIICKHCQETFAVIVEEGGIVYCPYCQAQYVEHNKAFSHIERLILVDLQRMSYHQGNYVVEYDRQYYWGMIDLARSMELITEDEGNKLYELKEKFLGV